MAYYFLQNNLKEDFFMLKVCLIGLGKTGREIARMIFNQRNMKKIFLLIQFELVVLLGSMKF